MVARREVGNGEVGVGRAVAVGDEGGRGDLRTVEREAPLVIALNNDDACLHAHAVLTTLEHVAQVFGFARRYFHADLPTVGESDSENIPYTVGCHRDYLVLNQPEVLIN